MKKTVIQYFFLLLIFWPFVLCSQNGSNPFEMKFRMDRSSSLSINEEIVAPVITTNPLDKYVDSVVVITDSSQNLIPIDTTSNIDTTIINQDSTKTGIGITTVPSNPFDINRTSAIISAKKESEKIVESHKVVKKVPQGVAPPDAEIKRFKFWMVGIILFLVSILLSLYRTFIGNIYKAFTNANFLKLLHRQNTSSSFLPYFLLYAMFFINAGIFLFLVINFFSENRYFNFSTLIYLILGLGGLYALKHLVLSLLGLIFPISKETMQYSFTIMIFNILLGIFLVPVNAIFMNSAGSMASFMMYLGGGVLLAALLFRILRSLFLASKYISFHKFHFFMYLCTVEIAPVIVLLKFVLSKTGL